MLRVRVELIPHGRFDLAETLDEVFVVNDGTGIATGPNEGGIGNYRVIREATHGSADHSGDNLLGRIEGVERTPRHRLDLSIRALQMLRQGNEPRRAGL